VSNIIQFYNHSSFSNNNLAAQDYVIPVKAASRCGELRFYAECTYGWKHVFASEMLVPSTRRHGVISRKTRTQQKCQCYSVVLYTRTVAVETTVRGAAHSSP
jgi:hypothetical protein